MEEKSLSWRTGISAATAASIAGIVYISGQPSWLGVFILTWGLLFALMLPRVRSEMLYAVPNTEELNTEQLVPAIDFVETLPKGTPLIYINTPVEDAPLVRLLVTLDKKHSDGFWKVRVLKHLYVSPGAPTYTNGEYSVFRSADLFALMPEKS